MEEVKRKTIFIKKDIQVRFVLFILLTVLFGMVLLGYEFLNFLQGIFAEHPALLQGVYERGPELFYPLIIKVTLFFVLIAIVAALLSNKIAGPVYRFEQVCKQIRDGDKNARIKLREGDALCELESDFNSMLDKLTKKGVDK